MKRPKKTSLQTRQVKCISTVQSFTPLLLSRPCGSASMVLLLKFEAL